MFPVMKKSKKKKDVINQKLERICSLFCAVSLGIVFIVELIDRLKEKR